MDFAIRPAIEDLRGRIARFLEECVYLREAEWLRWEEGRRESTHRAPNAIRKSGRWGQLGSDPLAQTRTPHAASIPRQNCSACSSPSTDPVGEEKGEHQGD